MALTNVQGYLTSDGKFFFKNQKEDAEAHEEVLHFRSWCNDNICRGGEWSAKMVADEILANWEVRPRF